MEEGQRAYELANAAVMSAMQNGTLVEQGGDIKVVEISRYRRELGEVVADCLAERTYTKCEWHARVYDADGQLVLDVIYDTNLTASECLVIRYEPGPWEKLFC